ncbi:MAG TPA: hypothetical protein VIC84_23680 [Blastocatellia bacterium]|jgi:hypothetical protein
MNLKARIGRIEERLASIPPNGAALLRKLKGVTRDEQERAIAVMSDAELEAVVFIDDEIGRYLRSLTDEELEAIVN